MVQHHDVAIIILMPIFWKISSFVGTNVKRGAMVALITIVLYFAWLQFYDIYVFHGPHEKNWYLLDRIFISFFIYGIYGVLAWQLRGYVNSFLYRFWWLILVRFAGNLSTVMLLLICGITQ